MGVFRKATDAAIDRLADAIAGREESTQAEIDRDIASLNEQSQDGGKTGGDQ